MQKTISVFMIVKNEALNLHASLSVVKSFASEIIVADSFSTDDSVNIAESYGAKVFKREMTSFTEQKQFALEQCTGDWVLNIDADEVITDELRCEILSAVAAPKASLYFLPLVNVFLGRRMRHSGLASQSKPRLALREKAKYKGGKVHETLTVSDGTSAYLKSPFLHTPYRDVAQYFDKFNNYTSLGAQSLYENGKKFKKLSVFRPVFDFLLVYIFRLGFLDGLAGFYWALFSSMYPVVKYAKLRDMQRK